MTEEAVLYLFGCFVLTFAAVFWLSWQVDRLARRSSEQTEQIIDLQLRLGNAHNTIEWLQAKVQSTHDTKLADLDDRLNSAEWTLMNLTDD